MSIVLTGAAVLAAVSTVVAFKGWPGAAPTQPGTPAAMLAESSNVAAAQRVSARAPIVVPAARARARSAASRSRGAGSAVRRSATPRTTVVAGTTPGSGSVGTSSSGQVTGAGTGTVTPVAAPKTPQAGDAVRNTGAVLGGATTKVVGDVGNVVAPVSPQLDTTVDGVGQVVGDTVQGVTNTVADVLDSLLPPK